MVDIIEKVKKEISYEGLNMRIGIHTGLLIGGIIGTEVVRYDIYGAANMIANNMESEGKVPEFPFFFLSYPRLDT